MSAGGIVWKRTPRGPLVLFILDPYGKWAFAKGHVRSGRGESLRSAAVREVEEETGLAGLKIGQKLGMTEIWFRNKHRHDGALTHKFITWFLMEAPARTLVRPARGEGIHRFAWVPAARAIRFSNYENVKPIIRQALKLMV